MKLSRLLRRNLRFHRRANFALLLGVAVGTAVLTGALLVGDSLRGSLRDRALLRLGGLENALFAPRFVREDIAEVDGKNCYWAQPAILVKGTIEVETENGIRRATDVTVQARRQLISWVVWDTSFNPVQFIRSLLRLKPPPPTIGPARSRPHFLEALVSADLVRELSLSQNAAKMRVRVPAVSTVSRESVFGRKSISDATDHVEFHVTPLTPDDPDGWFNPDGSIAPNRSVYLDLGALERLLGVEHRANAFFFVGVPPPTLKFLLIHFGMSLRTSATRSEALLFFLDHGKSGQIASREYRRRLAESMVQAADTNGDKILTKEELITYFTHRGTIDLEAEGLLLTPPAEQAALAAAKELNIPATSTLVYLANSISDGTNEIPYSVIAAVEPQLAAPLGPYLDPKEPPLADDEILLADWPESPLTAKIGDTITVRFFLPESEGKATETSATFKLRGKVPMTGVGADPYLAPEFPGITDKLTLGEWDPPFPYDNTKIKKRDEDYWDRYRATPKAYVNRAAGRKLFGSRFGFATSVRFAAASYDDAQRINDALLKHLKPEDFGLVFEDVRAKALAASQGGTDFGGLFLGFSFFLIAGALMLVGLLWKLSLDKRASEIGLLFASGFRVASVRRLLLMEGLIVAAFGAVFGLVLAIGYGLLMLKLLAALWPDEGVASFLTLHVEPQTPAIGFFGMMLLTGATVWWSLRSLRRVAPAMLLRGEILPFSPRSMTGGGINSDLNHGPATNAGILHVSPPVIDRGLNIAVLICALLGIIATIAGVFIHDHEARAGSFFTGGGLLLIAGSLTFRSFMLRQNRVIPIPVESLTQLGRRNIARHPGRSLLTAGLIASATFLLVAVESFRRNPASDFAERTGGSGGYDLIASTDVPLYQDLNDRDTGRKELLDGLERVYQKDPATKAAKLKAAEELLAASEFMALRLRVGDDAGCRNLARPDKPRLIGVPQRFIDRGGFQFAEVVKEETFANPWMRLLDRDADGNVPIFGEANTVQWMLKISLGGLIPFKDSHGNEVNLRIVGTLQDSIFQGELMMSEKQFLQLFPETQGYGMLLATAPKGRADELRTLLETAFADRGLTATPAADKLRSYLAVENTYLSTFQILGGFGLLLAACGLGVVLLRNAIERRGELALLRALGLSPAAIGGMIRAENSAILFFGLAIGVVSALVSISPLFVTGEASLRPLVRVAAFLLGVIVVGMFAGALAIRSTLRAPIVPALRNE
jgi:ABC-type lipoprotein release transport system permease subunit